MSCKTIVAAEGISKYEYLLVGVKATKVFNLGLFQAPLYWNPTPGLGWLGWYKQAEREIRRGRLKRIHKRKNFMRDHEEEMMEMEESGLQWKERMEQIVYKFRKDIGTNLSNTY